MIIGDPNKFAVLFDRVDQWNALDEDYNGFFNLSIDAEIISKTAINAIIFTSLFDIKEALKNAPLNKQIYLENAFEAHRDLYNLVYGDDDNDFRYLLSTIDFTDEGIFAFVVKNDLKTRIISAEGNYDYEKSVRYFDEKTVKEIVLEENEVNDIIDKIEIFLSEHENK